MPLAKDKHLFWSVNRDGTSCLLQSCLANKVRNVVYTSSSAVYGVPREVEYGLAFYRDQTIPRYESGSIPAVEHLLVAPTSWMDNVAKATAGRRVSFLGHYAPQQLDYYWVSAAPRTR